jgi:hypothetical protein
MDHVLILGFNCFVYKKNPRARIFVNDYFIDEFEVDEFISNFFLERLGENQNIKGFIKRKNKTVYKDKLFPKLKVYTISHNLLRESNKIKIEVENNDNNYTNGFMTLSTMLELMHFYLIPKKIIDRYLKFFSKDKVLNQKISDSTVIRKMPPVFENLTSTTDWIADGMSPINSCLYTVGQPGYFEAKFEMHNKHLKPTLTNGPYGKTTMINKVSREYKARWKAFIFDKYSQHENLRNNHERTGHSGSDLGG